MIDSYGSCKTMTVGPQTTPKNNIHLIIGETGHARSLYTLDQAIDAAETQKILLVDGHNPPQFLHQRMEWTLQRKKISYNHNLYIVSSQELLEHPMKLLDQNDCQRWCHSFKRYQHVYLDNISNFLQPCYHQTKDEHLAITHLFQKLTECAPTQFTIVEQLMTNGQPVNLHKHLHFAADTTHLKKIGFGDGYLRLQFNKSIVKKFFPIVTRDAIQNVDLFNAAQEGRGWVDE